MAKYRCPVCGATHKQLPEHCRLCGQKMGEDAVVGDFSGSRHVNEKKKGVAGIAVAVLIGVLVLVLVLVLIGLAPGGKQVDSVARNIPGLPTQGDDGWSELSSPEGGFTARFPGGMREQQSGVALPVATATGTEYTANLSDDTIVFVAYAPLDEADRAPTAGQTGSTLSGKARVRQIADRYAAAYEAQGAKVDKRDETGVGGYPALYVELRNVKDPAFPGKTFYVRALIVARGDTVYVIGTKSIYKDAEQFDKLAGSFAFTEKSSADTSIAP
ncbi:MAG: hypothetical protein R2726_15755 [Acidimicrobiales bacterium]